MDWIRVGKSIGCIRDVTGIMVFSGRIALLVAACAAIAGCSRYAGRGDDGFALVPGDLLFQDLDGGPLCEAIEKVTTGCQGQNFSHVGIVARGEHGEIVVIEAGSAGVKATSLQSFLGRSFDAEGRPKVVVGRLKACCRHLIPSALREAFALRGRPYDKVFDAGNDAYYCSELVYEVFVRANKGVALFAMQPMTFKDPETGRTDPVWERYFAGLGVSVPEGEPGINPGAISRSDILTIVHAYGTPSQKGSGGMGNDSPTARSEASPSRL